MASVDIAIRAHLDWVLKQIEENQNADVMALVGPITFGYEHRVRNAIEGIPDKKEKLVVILDTLGGVVEVAERMVEVLRCNYAEVVFVIPDRAMSAGTVLAMSGDAIMMDYFSCLGPIDPQIEKDGRLVPALSYLVQYDRLVEKASNSDLTSAEFVLLGKLDLAELHLFEEAKELSISLLEKWLANYKFKNWTKTETRSIPVTREMREERARKIAEKLCDNERWHSHGRGISMAVLQGELNLRIDDFGQDDKLKGWIHSYHGMLVDYMARQRLPQFLHTRVFF